MATTIKLKNGSGAPLAGDLVQGEPALDLTNKRLYSEDSGGTVIEIGTNPSTIDINAGTIDGTVIGGASAAAGTFTNLTATGTVTLPANGVSGDVIDGGTISNFASTGIDDNATSTAITIDSSGNLLVGTTDSVIYNNSGSGNGGIVLSNTGSGNGRIDVARAGSCYTANRLVNDGVIFDIRKDGTNVGGIGTNGGSLYIETSGSERMRIDSSGNVGIGTSSPTSHLHITAANPTVYLETTGGGATDASFIQKYNNDFYIYNKEATGNLYLGTNNSTKVTVDSSGNVGIGVSPSYRLDVAQTSRIAFDLANAYTLIGHYNAAGSAYATSYQNALVHYWQCSGTSRMYLASNGDLHADGNVIAYSTTISDERLKDDVATIDSALDKVSNLRGVTYTWNAGSREGKRDLGVIAQEVEAVIPEIVHEHEMPLLDGETYKTVDYEKLCAVLIEAVKELKAEVDALKGV